MLVCIEAKAQPDMDSIRSSVVGVENPKADQKMNINPPFFAFSFSTLDFLASRVEQIGLCYVPTLTHYLRLSFW